MDSSYILLIVAGALLLLGLGIIIFFRFRYNIYINKRLNGETEKRKFFNYKAFAIIMAVNVLIAVATFSCLSLINARIERDYYKMRLEELSPRYTLITDDKIISEFEWITDGIQNLNLSGYNITKMANGDFECYVARAKDAVLNNSLLPTYAIYFKYTGGELVNPTIEFMYTYSWGQSGSSVTFNEQYLYFSRLYSDEGLFNTVNITINVDTHGNKNPQLHSQSHFDFSNK